MLCLLSVTILPAATPDPKTEKEIMATMEAYKQALMKKDAAALSRILSDDLVYTHSSNLHENKTAVLDSLKSNTVVEGIDSPPILMGHSAGGAFLQLLLDRGLGAVGVAINSAPTEGVRVTPLSQLKSFFPVLKNPANRHKAVGFTYEQWR